MLDGGVIGIRDILIWVGVVMFTNEKEIVGIMVLILTELVLFRATPLCHRSKLASSAIN